MHLRSTSIIKITVKKMAISLNLAVTIGAEVITQLLKSNFDWSKCKLRDQCQAFAKGGTFFRTCPNTFKSENCKSHYAIVRTPG